MTFRVISVNRPGRTRILCGVGAGRYPPAIRLDYACFYETLNKLIDTQCRECNGRHKNKCTPAAWSKQACCSKKKDGACQCGDHRRVEGDDEGHGVCRVMPCVQESGTHDQAPTEINIGIEQIDDNGLDECAGYRRSRFRACRILLLPLSETRPGQIDEKNTACRLQNPAHGFRNAIEYQQNEKSDRPVTDQRGKRGWKRAFPAFLRDAGQQKRLQRARHNSGGECKSAADKNALKHSDLSFHVWRPSGATAERPICN